MGDLVPESRAMKHLRKIVTTIQRELTETGEGISYRRLRAKRRKKGDGDL